MGEVGQRFQDGKAFVPQLLMAGRAMKGALELLKPLLAGNASTTIGKIVIGTVKGDLHDIGKNLVASMLEGCGFEAVSYTHLEYRRQRGTVRCLFSSAGESSGICPSLAPTCHRRRKRKFLVLPDKCFGTAGPAGRVVSGISVGNNLLLSPFGGRHGNG